MNTRSVVLHLLAGILFLAPFHVSHAQEELSVLEDWLAFSDLENALYDHLAQESYRQLERRNEAVAPLIARADWQRRQATVREHLQEALGAFPERTPLQARTVGALDREGYRVEHLIYESVPEFHVTGSLFIPDDLDAPAPAVLYLSGHTNEAYRSETYQHVILNLVAKGFVVLAIDPIGQGERLQYVDPETGESTVGGATNQHSYVGAQAFLTGASPAWILTWDAIRAIDYLEDRPEVDSDRIGVTGRSGGGTQTAYVAALDERVRAAAPENYITSFRRLLQSIGPQDAEQNLVHSLARGLDHADLLTVRAPRPTLMISTTRDFFSIQGARETAQEVERAYAAFGASDHFNMVEDDAGHASTEANREALYAFFQQHLNQPGTPTDEAVDTLPVEQLQVTETGQVATSLTGNTPFDLVRSRAERQLDALDSMRRDRSTHLPAAVRSAQSLSGYRPPEASGRAIFTGRYQRSDYVIEKYALARDDRYPIPFLLFLPKESGPHPGLLYLHPDGKDAEADAGGQIEQLVAQGYAVLAPDLARHGELGAPLAGDSYIEGVSYNRWFASILTGRSIVGLQAEDLTQLADHFRGRDDIRGDTLTAVAQGSTTPALLHAAAFDDQFDRIALLDPLLTYGALATHKHYDPSFIPASVAGALTGYDLPDLAAHLAPRSLLLARPLDAQGQPAPSDTVTAQYDVARRAYTDHDASAALRMETSIDAPRARSLLLDWLAGEE